MFGWMIITSFIVVGYVECRKEYCTQNSTCWPDTSVWDAFAKSLTGKLHKLHLYDYKVCEDQGSDAFKIANISYCMQYHDCSKEFCDPESKVLNVPAYSAEVKTVSDIQKAISFANTHNIAVTIKTSGHSYSGSSTGKDTIMIWMHNFVKFGEVNNYTDTCGTFHEYAIKVGGGQPWNDIYRKLRNEYHIVGGGGLTVSAAGGWLQGCGLSAMSRKYGIGIDNVLEFEIVLANGSYVKADACHNAELFWALRGGGGGTWGVVTSVHYKIRKAEPVTFLYLLITDIGPPKRETKTVDSFLERWVSLSPYLDRRWGGYWTLNNLIMYFVGNKQDAERTFVDSLYKWRDSLSPSQQSAVEITLTEFDSYYNSRGGNKMTTDQTGQNTFNIASRLIPRDWVIKNKETALSTLRWIVRNDFFTFNYILGGAVTEVGDNETAVHPAMRKAIWQMETFTDKQAQKLREVIPNTGAGYNHASKKEPDWRKSFWGSNLKRLQKLKKKYDPDNRFNCWHCIGYQGDEGPSTQGSLSNIIKPSIIIILTTFLAFLLRS